MSALIIFADEDPKHLGERLSLPPFLEPKRQQIEAGLQPLETKNLFADKI